MMGWALEHKLEGGKNLIIDIEIDLVSRISVSCHPISLLPLLNEFHIKSVSKMVTLWSQRKCPCAFLKKLYSSFIFQSFLLLCGFTKVWHDKWHVAVSHLGGIVHAYNCKYAGQYFHTTFIFLFIKRAIV